MSDTTMVTLSAHAWALAQIKMPTEPGCFLAAVMSGAAVWSASDFVLGRWLLAEDALHPMGIIKRVRNTPHPNATWVPSDWFMFPRPIRTGTRVTYLAAARCAVAEWVLSQPDEVRTLAARAPIPHSAQY